MPTVQVMTEEPAEQFDVALDFVLALSILVRQTKIELELFDVGHATYSDVIQPPHASADYETHNPCRPQRSRAS